MHFIIKYYLKNNRVFYLFIVKLITLTCYSNKSKFETLKNIKFLFSTVNGKKSVQPKLKKKYSLYGRNPFRM